MAENVLDELVIRLGLDTSSVQSSAHDALNTLDVLDARSRDVSTQVAQRQTQAAASLSQIQREALGLMGVITGGRGLSSVLRQLGEGGSALSSVSSAVQAQRSAPSSAEGRAVARQSLAAFYAAPPPGAEAGAWSAGLPRTLALAPQARVSDAEQNVRRAVPAQSGEAVLPRGLGKPARQSVLPGVEAPLRESIASSFSLTQRVEHSARTEQQHVVTLRALPAPQGRSAAVMPSGVNALAVRQNTGALLTVSQGMHMPDRETSSSEFLSRPSDTGTREPESNSLLPPPVPYAEHAPLMQAATLPAAGVSAPAASHTTTYIGPVTISVPSGNPDDIAQALHHLGQGSSQTLAGLSTVGSV